MDSDGRMLVWCTAIAASVMITLMVLASVAGARNHEEAMARIEHGCLAPEVKEP